MSQYDHFTVLFVELPNCLPEVVFGLVSFGDHFGIEAVFFILNGDRFFGPIETLCFFVFKLPKMAETLIFQNLVEPWEKLVIRIEGVEFSIGLEKGLL